MTLNTEKVKWFVLWLTLALIILLTVLSIFGAFLGADRAKIFFNSIPLAVYWIALALTFVAGFVLFKTLVRVPAALLVHLGCVAILIGGLWGSIGGRKLQAAWFGHQIIPQGQMFILSGSMTNRVRIGDDREMQLPFDIALDRFRLEYYEPGKLLVGSTDGRGSWTLPAKVGTEYNLGSAYGTVKIVKTFENFKMDLEGERRVYDDPNSGSNPAVEVMVTYPDGHSEKRYEFEKQSMHVNEHSPLRMQYRRTIRDYISHVRVLKDGNTVAGKAVEVNHPLYYGGYHFYQSSYGQDGTGRMYTVLSVYSNSGLNWVFGGYLLLCLGVAWKCWFIRLRPGLQEVKNHGR